MTYSAIRYEVKDNIATILLNRPERMNAISTPMRIEMLDAVKHAETEARVLLITGEGTSFCSGQDLVDAASLAELDIERVLREEYEPLLKAIQNCKIPTIAAVNGPAAGAGCGLALSADIVMAKESAFFDIGFTRIGLIPDAGLTYWLPRLMGFGRAMSMALLSERLSAKDAAASGLIYRAIADDAFEDEVTKILTKLANGPSATYALLKQALHRSMENSFEAQLSVEAELQGIAGRTRDFKEGVMAFLEKRAPKYLGR